MQEDINMLSDTELVEKIALLLNTGRLTSEVEFYKRASNKIRLLQERHSNNDTKLRILTNCLNHVVNIKRSDLVSDHANNCELIQYVITDLNENFR